MKILFSTTNEAKIRKYVEKLKRNNIDVISIKDLGFKLDVDENGKDAIENAKIKAKAYFDKTNITSIGIDDTLYLKGVSDEDQPGTQVRRVNGKELTDDEMIKHYISLVRKYSGTKNKLSAKWIHGISIYNGNEFKNFSWSNSEFYLVDKENYKRNNGYPLDSISVDKNTNKYFVDILTENIEKEKSNEIEKNKNTDVDKKTKDIIDFIINNI